MKPACLAALCAILATPAANAAVGAHSYVQRGLAGCYDGIDNAGAGTHDPAAAEWADLAGRCGAGTMGEGVGWAANGWTNAVNGHPVRLGMALSDLASYGAFTIQFACTPSRSSARQAFFSNYVRGSAGSMSVEHNDGSAGTGRLRFFLEDSNYSSVLFPLVVPQDEFSSVSVSMDTLRLVCWRNGGESYTNAALAGTPLSGLYSYVGGDADRGEMAFRGTYNAFRFYDRVLTAAEAKANAAVDAIRFHGADPGDFALGGGYAFDGDGDLCVTVSATAGEVNGAPGGTVAIDGGAAGASASATAKQYATFPIVATPAADLVFVRWDGDTDVISAGTATNAAITVVASSAANLVAVFRAEGDDPGGGGGEGADGSALTSRSYVQRGLVAQFDGIDNAGVGLHDDAAATWADLTGHGNDGTVSAAVSWTSNGWQNAANGRPVTIPAGGVSEATGSGAFTVQFACNPSRDTQRECFFSQYGAGAGAFGLEHNNGSTSAGRIRVYRSQVSSFQTLDILTPMAVKKDEFSTVSVAIDGSSATCWKNAETITSSAAVYGTGMTNAPTVIGGEIDRVGMAFQGTYHACRVYDRPLTEAETKVNQAVDLIRFAGARPGDFALEGGYSFDTNGALRVTVSATTAGATGFANASGTVSAAGGAAGASASAVVVQHTPVALVATPDAGSIFFRWEGATDCISSGSALDASIVVDGGSSISLVAVFKERTRGLSAFSCVRRGLVAHFDGIDNAGTGAHDPNATTWADLTGNGNTGTLAANVTWASDGWMNAGECLPVSLAPGTISPVTASKTFTAQFACTPSRSNVRQIFFGQYSASGITIEHNSGGVSDGRIRLYYNLAYSAVSQEYNEIKVVADEWASIAATSEPDAQTVWKNGAASQSMSNPLNGTLVADCNSVIGCDLSRTAMSFRGTYNVFRLYDRVLTEDEIRLNAAVDAVRFGGRTTAEVSPLPDGWAFDENDTLLVRVDAAAGKGGRIRLGSGEPTRSVSNWYNQDGLDAVVLTAVPYQYYAFDGWTGDTDAIVDGSAGDPAVRIDTTRPVFLVANYVRAAEPPTIIVVK